MSSRREPCALACGDASQPIISVRANIVMNRSAALWLLLGSRCNFDVPRLNRASRRLPSAQPVSPGRLILAGRPRTRRERVIITNVAAGAPAPRLVAQRLPGLVLEVFACIAIVFFPFTR